MEIKNYDPSYNPLIYDPEFSKLAKTIRLLMVVKEETARYLREHSSEELKSLLSY